MANDFASLSKKLNGFAAELDGSAAKARLQRVALETKVDVDDAVRADLGDLSMSGWRRRSPFDVRGRYELLTDQEFEIQPQRKAIGPMRVLEQGRTAYNAGDQRRKGSYTSKKTGATTDRFRKVKRNVGATAGKGTWTDAVRLMEARVPARIHREVVKALSRHFRKG